MLGFKQSSQLKLRACGQEGSDSHLPAKGGLKAPAAEEPGAVAVYPQSEALWKTEVTSAPDSLWSARLAARLREP